MVFDSRRARLRQECDRCGSRWQWLLPPLVSLSLVRLRTTDVRGKKKEKIPSASLWLPQWLLGGEQPSASANPAPSPPEHSRLPKNPPPIEWESPPSGLAHFLQKKTILPSLFLYFFSAPPFCATSYFAAFQRRTVTRREKKQTKTKEEATDLLRMAGSTRTSTQLRASAGK